MENIALAGSRNVRDLGGTVVDGGTVREKLLLRGGNLFACTQRDAAILRDEYGLSLIVDLRTSVERIGKPDRSIPGVENVHIPLFAESTVGITRERLPRLTDDLAEIIPDLTVLYRRMVSIECRDNLSRVVQTIMDAIVQGRTVLFHCTEGKDRAGLTAAILLSALGAPRKAIMADYLFTNTVCTRKADRYYWLARMLRKDKATSEKLRAVFSVRADYLEAAFSAIEEEWGSTEAFIVQGLGVGPDRLEAFRNAAIAEEIAEGVR